MRKQVKTAFERFLVGLITAEEFNQEVDQAWAGLVTDVAGLTADLTVDLRRVIQDRVAE